MSQSQDKTYVGIDPGKSGAITILEGDYIKSYKCPDNAIDMAILFGIGINHSVFDTVVGIEKVWAFPTDAKSRAFAFGMNYGMWHGIAGSFEVKMKEIVPREWMSHFGVPKKLKKQHRKRWIKEKAMSLYPKVKITLYNADSVLIARYLQEVACH